MEKEEERVKPESLESVVYGSALSFVQKTKNPSDARGRASHEQPAGATDKKVIGKTSVASLSPAKQLSFLP